MDLDQFDTSRFQQLIRKRGVSQSDRPSPQTEHLPLPTHLQILLDQTESLMAALLAFRRRKQVSSFGKIRDFVELQTRHSFTEHTFSQVLRIAPEQTFTPEWHEDKRRTLPHELRVNLTTRSTVEEVVAFARQYLIDFVKGFHADFLRSIGQRVIDVREWHTNFNLSSVPPVAPVELARPVVQKQPTIMESLRAAIPKPEPVSVVPPRQSFVPIPKSCANLDSFFTVVKRVQEKEALNQQLTALAANRRTTELLAMSDHLNALFHGRGKRCLPLTEILHSIAQAPNFRVMEQAKLVEVIEELISKSDDYFRKLDVRGVAYVQVEPPSSRTYQMAKGPIVRACSAFAPMPMSLEGETGGRLL